MHIPGSPQKYENLKARSEWYFRYIQMIQGLFQVMR